MLLLPANQYEEDLEKMKRELLAAGWTQYRLGIWKSPKGYLFLGPAGAWKKLKRWGNRI